MWKTVLKEINMDKQSGCCEEARTRIVDWYEGHIQNNKPLEDDYTYVSKEGLLRMQSLYSELPCEELYAKFEEMVLWAEEAESKYDTSLEPYDDLHSLREILDEWDDCREEPESVEVKEQNPAMDNFPLFQNDPTAWMNQYIRGRK